MREMVYMGCLNALYEGSVSRGSLYCKFHPMVAPRWPFAPKCCHVINLPSLQSMAAVKLKASVKAYKLSEFYQCSASKLYTCICVSLPCSDCGHCSTSSQFLLSIGGSGPLAPLRLTVTPCLPIVKKENAAPWRIPSRSFPLPSIPHCTWPCFGLQRKDILPTWPLCYSTLIARHSVCKRLLNVGNANAKCKAGGCQRIGLIVTCT